MFMTVAEAMVRALEKEGTDTIFGYPGATICPFYDALIDSSIHHVLVRQEQNAAHAASGYARVTGKTGVVVVTSGPGATNLITGIATAYMDSVPLICITGQVNRDQIGKDVFQEADITGAAEPFTKNSYLVKDPQSIVRIIREAAYIASSGRPGPVLIDVPTDVQRSMIEYKFPESVSIRGYKPVKKGNAGQIKRIAAAIKSARRPVICLGGGVLSADAAADVQHLAETCGIPVVTTMMGLSALPTAHPLNLGMLGMHGNRVANEALHDCDALIIIGARVGDRAMAAVSDIEKHATIIHIDVDPAEIGKNLGTQVPVVGDAGIVLRQLAAIVEPADSAAWIDRMCTLNQQRGTDETARPAGWINPKRFLKQLSEALPEHTTVVADVGQNQIWTASNIVFRAGQRFLTSGGMGTMGYSIPAALGASIGKKEETVIALFGDGSFQMQMMELATICQEARPVKMILFENKQLGMVREVQKKQYHERYSAVSLAASPDFGKIAEAYGIAHMRMRGAEDTERAIHLLLSAKDAFFLIVPVDPDESSL